LSLTVASISSDVSIDIRQVLVPTDTKIAGWIDRVHKDVMHSSVYSYLNIATTSFNAISGVNSYILVPTNIRRILGVYDASTQRILFPIERATSPVSQVEKQEPSPGQQGSPAREYSNPAVSPMSLQNALPSYFRHIGAQQLNIYPAPAPNAPNRQMNVSYEQQVATLVNPTDVLLVPEDARDIIVAGVNYLANIFLKRIDEAQIWAQIFSSLKRGESLV
jgi:hypothetical protein